LSFGVSLKPKKKGEIMKKREKRKAALETIRGEDDWGQVEGLVERGADIKIKTVEIFGY